jgi:lipid II:glycine glycyltransferase (peptidoglycan interpeptide bridge formation enzyme)
MQKNMSNSRLRQVKKAIKNGVSWKEADDVNDIHAFYNILAELYKTKIKKPLFERDFFLQQFKQKISKFLLVYYQKKVIGGILCPVIEGKAIYEFYVCGLDQEYKNQYPSVMATWAAIKYANQNTSYASTKKKMEKILSPQGRIRRKSVFACG